MATLFPPMVIIPDAKGPLTQESKMRAGEIGTHQSLSSLPARTKIQSKMKVQEWS